MVSVCRIFSNSFEESESLLMCIECLESGKRGKITLNCEKLFPFCHSYAGLVWMMES